MKCKDPIDEANRQAEEQRVWRGHVLHLLICIAYNSIDPQPFGNEKDRDLRQMNGIIKPARDFYDREYGL